jgi:hypothetical protein
VGTCSGAGYTVADGSNTKTVPVLGQLTFRLFKKAASIFAAWSSTTTTVYTLEKAPLCAETDLPSEYVKAALSYDSNLKVGTCSGAGYTVADGSNTKTVPVLGQLTFRLFKKAAADGAGGDGWPYDPYHGGGWAAEEGQIWSSCGKSTDILSGVSVAISPSTPVKGQDVTVTASGTFSESVTAGAKAQVTVSLMGIQVINKSVDLCTADPNVSCPISSGYHSIKISELIPSTVPSGSYTGKVVATNADGKEITCVNLKFTL